MKEISNENKEEEKHVNPAMYKQVEDTQEPICCVVGRIAGDRCVWECNRRDWATVQFNRHSGEV